MNKTRLTTLAALSVIVFIWAFHPQFVTTGGNVLYSIGANVGVSVGVAPSEFSELAQQFDNKQKELEEREAAIIEAEGRLENNSVEAFSIEWYVTLMAFILLILVLMNFYLDFRHRQQSRV